MVFGMIGCFEDKEEFKLKTPRERTAETAVSARNKILF